MIDSYINESDIIWEKLFKNLSILDNISKYRYFILTSQMLQGINKTISFEHRNNLPHIFKENKLTILPITSDKYVIGNFDAYMELEEYDSSPIEYLDFPDTIQSIDCEKLQNNAMAINSAYVAGIFSNFLEDDNLLPTVSGEMFADKFNFKIKQTDSSFQNINTCNCLIDIDGGLEGVNSLSLIESKNYISTDFLVQKLYYPFRYWEKLVSKDIKSIFMFITNGIYYLHEYKFGEFNNYNSISLVKKKRYCLEMNDISLVDIQKILSETRIVEEPTFPFPQADSFERIINLCELLNKHPEPSKEIITSTYDFTERQTDYYTNAGRYLGLIDKKNNSGIQYFLTNEGRSLFKLNFKKRQLRLVRLILKHSVFSKSLALYLTKAEIPSTIMIVNIMKESNLYHVNTDVTYHRRASTVLSWLNWILSLQQ